MKKMPLEKVTSLAFTTFWHPCWYENVQRILQRIKDDVQCIIIFVSDWVSHLKVLYFYFNVTAFNRTNLHDFFQRYLGDATGMLVATEDGPFLQTRIENSFEKSCFCIRLQETLCHNSLRKAVVPVTLFE